MAATSSTCTAGSVAEHEDANKAAVRRLRARSLSRPPAQSPPPLLTPTPSLLVLSPFNTRTMSCSLFHADGRRPWSALLVLCSPLNTPATAPPSTRPARGTPPTSTPPSALSPHLVRTPQPTTTARSTPTGRPPATCRHRRSGRHRHRHHHRRTPPPPPPSPYPPTLAALPADSPLFGWIYSRALMAALIDAVQPRHRPRASHSEIGSRQVAAHVARWRPMASAVL